MATSSPPLKGLRVIELAGLAPGPFASLLLADFGASILRIDRPVSPAPSPTPPALTPDLLTRHKSSIALDLKSTSAVALLKELLIRADVFIDPFRPGILESLDLNPHALLTTNPRLIVARLTGFRRDGPYAKMAGHDINYLAVSGVLSQLGRKDFAPYGPANILADFAGGGLMCAFGILAALLHRTQTGKGQVVESNMVDGSAYLGTFMRLAMKTPLWDQPRGENLLDGGSPFYDVYECRDGEHMAVGALEPQFFHELVKGLKVDRDIASHRFDRDTWPTMRELFRKRFLEKSRQEWEHVFAGKDACCTPVLSQVELEEHGYEQRAAVHLSQSPSLKISEREAWSSKGISPSAGGETVLESWMGWRNGKDYKAEGGGLVKIETVKL